VFETMALRCAVFLVAGCLASGCLLAQDVPRVVHVFVALADNQNQGIVPVPAALGNGLDAERNLYWGSAYGVKTFFRRALEWKLLSSGQRPKPAILERCVFKHRTENVYLVADAYRGAEIRQAILDFLDAAAGASSEPLNIVENSRSVSLHAAGAANLVAYVGHEGLMDFQLPRLAGQKLAGQKNDQHRDSIILACLSKSYFRSPLRRTGAYPLLWTTGLMAPEAYTLKSALDGWIAGDENEKIRNRAAAAYAKYQKCSLQAAHRLLTTGW
jgi:hypothetical protein